MTKKTRESIKLTDTQFEKAEHILDAYYAMHRLSPDFSTPRCAEPSKSLLINIPEWVESDLPLQCRCVALPVQCDGCDQTAMHGYSLCADCQTTAEAKDFKPVPLPGLEPTEQRRPDRVLGDWVMRPCGTIADRGIR